MTDVTNKDINPIEPLGEGEPEPTPVEGPIEYPGYQRRGKIIQFPLRPPTAGRPQKGPPGGAA